MAINGTLARLSLVLLAACAGCSSAAAAEPSPAPDTGFPPSEDQTRANVTAAFERLSGGRYVEHVERSFGPDSTLVIHGTPPEYAGAFTGPAAITEGLKSLYTIAPTHSFKLSEIWVTTKDTEVTAAVAWTDDAIWLDGQALPCHGMNSIRIGPRGVVEEHIFIAPDQGWPE